MSNLVQFGNYTRTTIASAVLVGDGTLNVTSSAGFPVPAAGTYFYCTLIDAVSAASGVVPPLKREIIKVTAIAALVWTIVRAQDGTAAQTWAIGDGAELRLTTAALNEIAFHNYGTVVAPAITNGGSASWEQIGNDSAVTPNSIYNAIFPGVSDFDIFAKVLHVAAGSTVTTMTASAAYVKNDVAVSGVSRNAVAMFGCGMGTVDNSATFGINTLLQDAATRVVHAGVGRQLIGAELDFNVMGAATTIIGVSAGGNSLAQPVAANAFIANSLGVGFKWTGGFVTFDNTCQFAISFGASAAAGVSVPGQTIVLNCYDSAAAGRNVQLLATANGRLQVGGTATTGNGGIELASVGARIFGDFSNGTAASRPSFQTTQANNITVVAALPSGTGTIGAFTAYAQSDPDTAPSFASLQAIQGSKTRILSNKAGAGTVLPFTIEVGTNVAATFDTSGNVQFGFGTGFAVAAAKTANYTALTTDSFLRGNTTAGAFAITLPAANALGAGKSQWIVVKRIDSSANLLTVQRAGADTIDGGTNTTFAALVAKEFRSDGVSNWDIL